MFFDSLQTMLMKQNLQQYLFSSANILRYNPLHRLQPIIVQVISNEIVSDGITNFHCRFKKPSKKGSIIRLIQWQLQLTNFQLVIDQYQYLGGQGYAIKNGKPWDIEKLKLASNSNILSNDFVVLHCPANSAISQKNQGFQACKNNQPGTHSNNIQMVKLPTTKVKTFFPSFALKKYQNKPSKIKQKQNQKSDQIKPNISKQADKKQVINNLQNTHSNSSAHQPIKHQQPDRILYNNKNLSFLNTQPSTKTYNSHNSHNSHNQQLDDQLKNEQPTDTKSYTFSQFDIHKVKKLKINTQQDQQTLKNISIKTFTSKYKNIKQSHNNNNQQQSDSMVHLSQMDIQQNQSDINMNMNVNVNRINENSRNNKLTRSQIKQQSQHISNNNQIVSKSVPSFKNMLNNKIKTQIQQHIQHSQDSIGRQLTFNKQQISKLLGKQ